MKTNNKKSKRIKNKRRNNQDKDLKSLSYNIESLQKIYKRN